METVVVMYPSPGIGHVISMVELGKLIITHHPSISITILTTTPPFNTGSTAPYIRHVSATVPSITFHNLPPISIDLDPNSYSSIPAATFDFLRLNLPNVLHALRSISLSATISAFVVDIFCTPALSVGTELRIPTYCFFTSGAGCLAAYLYFPFLHRNTTRSLKDCHGENLYFPGLPPIPALDMPAPLLDRTSMEYKFLIEYFKLMPKTAGIITNTFEALEPKFVQALSDGLCVPDGPTPPVYCIGPLIATDHGGGGGDECLAWLDSQPRQSVVFLCFGSLGLFTDEQLKEIAVALEKSGQRFLWVVKSPPSSDKTKMFFATPEPELGTLLPAGFLDRTRERGLVVKSWAPQVEVLKHDSVGGFVTHCGWNSVLEAVCGGVPMVAWPLYAEQRLNRVLMVEELKLALPLCESETGFVSAGELEKIVRQLMESEEGKVIRSSVVAAREAAAAAMSQGGSSVAAFARFVESWNRN